MQHLQKTGGGGVFRTLRFNFQMLTVNLPIPNPLPYLVTSLRPPFGAHLPQRSIAPPKGNAILDLAIQSAQRNEAFPQTRSLLGSPCLPSVLPPGLRCPR